MQVCKSDVHFGVTAVFAADLDIDTAVKITANKTVDKHDGSGTLIGVVTAKRNVKNNGTVDVLAKHHIKCKIQTAVTAGQSFKFGALDGTTGENRIAPWVAGTDAIELRAGVVWIGGGSGATAEAFLQ